MATYNPAYVVQSIIYAVPGNPASEVYATQSTEGSSWTTKTTTEASIAVGVVGTKNGSAFTLSTYSQDQVSTEKSVTDTETYNFASNQVDHGEDRIYLWTNPVIDLYESCGGAVNNGSLGIYRVSDNYPWIDKTYWQPGTPWVQVFTVKELVHPETITEYYKKTFLWVTPPSRTDPGVLRVPVESIKAKILALDPFVATDGSIIDLPDLSSMPDRFHFVTSGDEPGGCGAWFTLGDKNANVMSCKATFKSGKAHQEGTKYKFANTLDILLGTPPVAQVTATLSIEYETTRQWSSSVENDATVTMQDSDPVNTCIDGNIYIDALFGTYAVRSKARLCSQPASASILVVQ